MKLSKKLNIILILALTLTLLTPSAVPTAEAAGKAKIANSKSNKNKQNNSKKNAAAKKKKTIIKINKKKKTLRVGDTYQLKLTGTDQEITWTSSKEEVATVTAEGLVEAKAVGKTNITAKAGDKKYTCKITVKAAKNETTTTTTPGAIEVPTSEAISVEAGKFTFSAPKSWLTSVIPMKDSYLCGIRPSYTSASNVIVVIEESKIDAFDYTTLKEEFSSKLTEETIREFIASSDPKGKLDLEITEFKTEDVTTSLGTAFKISCTATSSICDKTYTASQTQYILVIEDYVIMVVANSYANENIADSSIMEVAEMIVQSLTIK